MNNEEVLASTLQYVRDWLDDEIERCSLPALLLVIDVALHNNKAASC